jgi:hypothetical protein
MNLEIISGALAALCVVTAWSMQKSDFFMGKSAQSAPAQANKKIAVLTFKRSAELCIDKQYLESLFTQEGLIYQEVIWDTPGVDWHQYDAVIIRSACDYFDGKYEQFINTLQHIEKLGIPLYNPLDTVRWNSKKTYLSDLKERGINVIETIFGNSSQIKNLAEIMKENNWHACVVKPVISAAAYKTFFIKLHDAQEFDFSAHFSPNEFFLIQPFAQEIIDEGEWSFIFFDKKFSHAMLSKPKQWDFRVQFFHGGRLLPVKPEPWMVQEAQRILQAAPFEKILYARVDAIKRDNKLFVMELEMIEPYLYFDYYPDSAKTFVKTIKQYLAY